MAQLAYIYVALLKQCRIQVLESAFSFYLDRLYEHEFIHHNKKIIRHLKIPIIANSYVKSMSMDIYRVLF